MFETGVVRANKSVNNSARSRGILGIYFGFSST